MPFIDYLCGVINNNTMAEEKKIQKGKIKTVEDANWTDRNGNMYFWITFEEAPTVVGTIGIRPNTSMKVGDEMFYSAETRRDKNNKEFIRFHREQDPALAQQAPQGKGKQYYSEDPKVKVIAMCLSYANELAVAGKIDPSKVTAVATDYVSWTWGKIDEAKG